MEYEGSLQKAHTAKERYSKLTTEREHYLDRAEECSELTIIHSNQLVQEVSTI